MSAIETIRETLKELDSKCLKLADDVADMCAEHEEIRAQLRCDLDTAKEDLSDAVDLIDELVTALLCGGNDVDLSMRANEFIRRTKAPTERTR